MAANTPTSSNGPRSFLFINKDPSSASLSKSTEGTVATSISSHVQKWISGSAPAKKPQQRRPSLIVEANTSKRRRPSNIRKASLYIQNRTDQSSDECRTTEVPAHTDTELEDKSKTHQLLLSTNFSIGDSIDPFASTGWPISRAVHNVLEYYMTFTLVSTTIPEVLNKSTLQRYQITSQCHSPPSPRKPAGELVPVKPSHTKAIRAVISGCMVNQMHLFALLSATAGRMRKVNHIGFSSNESPEYYMAMAISSLRKHLAYCAAKGSLTDRQVILDIFYLCVCEWYLEDFEAARVHLGIISHLLKLLQPSADKFDQYVYDIICYNDVFLAIETDSAPILPFQLETEPLHPDRLQQIKIELCGAVSRSVSIPSKGDTQSFLAPSTDFTSDLRATEPQLEPPLLAGLSIGSGFTRALLYCQILNEELRGVIQEAPHLLEIAHYARTFADTSATKSEISWASKQSLTLLHRLLSISTPLQANEKCIRITLIILMCDMSTSTAWRAGKINMAKLGRRLMYHVSDLESQLAMASLSRSLSNNPDEALCRKELMLWMLVTGMFACQDSNEEDWFLHKATASAEVLGLNTYEALRSMLEQYLYWDNLQSKTLRKLAQKLAPHDPNPTARSADALRLPFPMLHRPNERDAAVVVKNEANRNLIWAE